MNRFKDVRFTRVGEEIYRPKVKRRSRYFIYVFFASFFIIGAVILFFGN